MAGSEKGSQKTIQGRGRRRRRGHGRGHGRGSGRGRGIRRGRSNKNQGGGAGQTEYSSPKSKCTVNDTSTTPLTKNSGISPTLLDSESQFPITFLSTSEPKLVPNVNLADKETSATEQTSTLMSSQKSLEDNVPPPQSTLQPDTISP